ncbi:hypothetical protein BKA66DRAFT_611866 [Pyrenochaeta sp. MPI-SDFR-AT-0127]|nr:hypothetical protein BKA66DRAFT_611866 [Pyrenochaeta sp. MPI-SDFR-AT-0127]
MAAGEGILPFLGVTLVPDQQGKPWWTINIITDEADPQPRSAYFDAQIGVWKLRKLPDDEAANPVVGSRQSSAQPRATDWTKGLPSSKHTDFFRNLDWTATPLGPCQTWPRSLRLYTHMLFSDNRAAAIYWGPQRNAIYNENLLPLVGSLHPKLMSRSFEEVMPNLWNFFGPVFQAIEKDQLGFAQDRLELAVTRDDYLEETWWDGGIIPLKDDDNNHGGVYFSWTEVTRTVLENRRTTMLNRLGHSVLMPVSSIWQHIYDVFTDYPREIPMAIMYNADKEDPRNGRLHLKHTIGIGHAYTSAPEKLNFISTDQDAALAPLLRRALKTTADFVVVDLLKEKVDSAILDNINWLGFGEPSRHLVIIPLRAKNLVRGYIVLGLNPRRNFDADHEQFIVDLAFQLRGLMTRIATEEDTRTREDNLMTELSDTERRISRLAEVVPVGIYELAADGSLSWANSQFYDIMDVPHDSRDSSLFQWMDNIHPDDHSQATEQMTRSLTDVVDITDTLRLNRKYRPPPQMRDNSSPTDEPSWIMYSASPNLNDDGSVHSLMGSLTDISHLKWTEKLHMRNAEKAQKERQRQEEFIDITSHEMRNPLSAITQCADSVVMSLQDATSSADAQSLIEIIKLNVEAAESILFCAAHQKRIIDDVLTLGKLESKLLTISPTRFQPKDLVIQALQMFKTEFSINEIEVRTIADGTSGSDGSLYTHGDSSRLMQILVNLLTNAIKFTKTQPTRKISIRYGASTSAPSAELFGPNFEWYSTEKVRPDLTQEPEYGKGAIVYVYYVVADSGKGISPEHRGKLFTKFEQADRRTHTEYGGSGLGLYISQELTEMQGGRIGIESKEGVGSTIAFYTKVRRSEAGSHKRFEPSRSAHSIIKPTDALGAVGFESSSSPTFLALFAKYNILLVEDNILNQKILAQQLRRAGCAVRVCSNGGEAVDRVLQVHGEPAEFGSLPPADALPYFDCILMDWEMPVCDGVSATKRIRAIETQHESPRNIIIGVTANARAEQMKKAIEAGMDTVMPKPFRVAELLAKISEVVMPHKMEL